MTKEELFVRWRLLEDAVKKSNGKYLSTQLKVMKDIKDEFQTIDDIYITGVNLLIERLGEISVDNSPKNNTKIFIIAAMLAIYQKGIDA